MAKYGLDPVDRLPLIDLLETKKEASGWGPSLLDVVHWDGSDPRSCLDLRAAAAHSSLHEPPSGLV